ncbi:gephyrin [Heterostelium album PN500]|uniref:Gephyrin n=1 Tax=Heterostelium pallidum (strain ATCC 26659 / Pp 5 / PN500) TaxID=670386 RepID=D3BJV5_HETP5|nr:gephyrin [Heterostelium album PN500]EFA78185.1 gephyrin [Heterostelium album PN500]|eukprot:XP_020430311.1 gephyrin [Heterostelium album PN500]
MTDIVQQPQLQSWEVGVLTISDRVSRQQAIDQSGPELIKIIKEQLKVILESQLNITLKLSVIYKVVPDDIDAIRSIVSQWIAKDFRMIITTGGTGFSPRDQTPEAIEPLIKKKTPGIVVAMLKSSLDITAHAMLSRPVAGITDMSLIFTLPGSVKAVRENFITIMPALPHALALIASDQKASLPESHQSKDINKQPTSFSSDDSSKFGVSHTQGGHGHSHGGHSHGHSHSHGHHTCGGNKDSVRGSKYPMIDVDKAVSIILEQCKDIKTVESVPIAESLGMACATSVESVEPFPPFRASIKDGYAVRSVDGVGQYVVLGSSLAGGGDAHRLTEQQLKAERSCVRITTGAMMPEGYDAVVMVEDTQIITKATESQLEVINVDVAVAVGQDIRAVGSDIKAGTTVLNKGDKIGAAEIGLLATLGVTTISVFKPPKITIISTGDELMPHDTKEVKEGFIRDSNSLTLSSIVKEASQHFGEVGAQTVKNYGIVKDELEPLKEALVKSAECSDVIITSGGVSMGELDLVKPLLEKLGKVHFGRVNMKPGKPLTFATIENGQTGKKTLVFALPGNPVSTMVTFYLFVLPALRQMSGHSQINLPLVETKLGERVRMDPERPEYHRCFISWDFNQSCFVSQSTGSQASCRLLSMKKSNALLILPKKEGLRSKKEHL